MRCGLCTLPAALIVLTGDPSRGLAWAVGIRWYVTPFFTTSLVLVMLLYSNPTVANEQWRFNERVSETVLGVGLAYSLGLLLPRVRRRIA